MSHKNKEPLYYSEQERISKWIPKPCPSDFPEKLKVRKNTKKIQIAFFQKIKKKYEKVRSENRPKSKYEKIHKKHKNINNQCMQNKHTKNLKSGKQQKKHYFLTM